MIINSVKIKNIRSIKSLDIEFPPSTMLFFGDIGSGKSSVLKAIEFGLFGTLNAAELSGDSLLRRGENYGNVELTFSIDNRKYIVQRALKRSKDGRIYQEKGTIIEFNGSNTIETSLAITDLRKRILELLNYSITRYEKTQKIPIFRYTVYTPQEQVKEIILAKPDERFEILKEVFGIEKYEIALKNVDIIKSLLNYKLKEIEIFLDTIGTPELRIPERKEEIVIQKKMIREIKNNLDQKEKEIKGEESKIDKLHSELTEHSNKMIKIESKQNIISNAENSIKNHEKSLSILIEEIIKSNEQLKTYPIIQLSTNLTEKQLEKELEINRKVKTQQENQKAVLNKKIKNIDKLLKEGKCSLCGQKIHEKERFNNELNNITKDIDDLSSKIENINMKISKNEVDLKNLREYTQNKLQRDSLESIIKEKKKREVDLKELINELKEKIKKGEKEISTILKKYEIMDTEKLIELKNNLQSKLSEQKTLVNQLKSEKAELRETLGSENTNLVHLESDLQNLQNDLMKKQDLRKKLEYLKDLKNWLVNEFQVLIRDIEREILAYSALQFNEYFKDWFRILVDDENIEVEIQRDDFQPTITVNGYESPFRDLSGGEKSALSLAYRLALNKIINERYHEIKTKDLLILDEPTDGFSQQQINKMQDIFEVLNTAQMIIISHETNLDSFVTDIFNFKKENHITKVTKES